MYWTQFQLVSVHPRLSKLERLLSSQPNPGLKAWTYHHYKPALPLRVYTRLILFLTKRC